MAFNHYAKIKRILSQEPAGWYIRCIHEPTKAKNFRGETISYEYYYRIYDHADQPIKYCKFQKIDKLASILNTDVAELIVI